MKFSVCKIISLFIKLLGSFLVLLHPFPLFITNTKKSVNFMLCTEVLDYLLSQTRKPTENRRRFDFLL